MVDLYASLQRSSAWSKVTRLDDGRFIAVSNRVMPGGGWIATHDDVTEREELHARLEKQHERALQQEEQLRRSNLQFDLAVNNMSQGLCFFDGAQRLMVCNDRYLEMYGLDPEQIRPGITLREIIDLRFEVGSFPAMSKEQYHAWRNSIAVSDKPSDTIVELKNGRIYEIHHRPMSDGGWVATHDDITERQRLKAELERNNKLCSASGPLCCRASSTTSPAASAFSTPTCASSSATTRPRRSSICPSGCSRTDRRGSRTSCASTPCAANTAPAMSRRPLPPSWLWRQTGPPIISSASARTAWCWTCAARRSKAAGSSPPTWTSPSATARRPRSRTWPDTTR